MTEITTQPSMRVFAQAVFVALLDAADGNRESAEYVAFLRDLAYGVATASPDTIRNLYDDAGGDAGAAAYEVASHGI